MTAVTGAARPATGPHPAQRQTPPLPGQAPRFRFAALDGLRAVAAVLVLGYGLREIVARLNPPAAVRYSLDGAGGAVDLLLVLGGFLICRRLLEPAAGGRQVSGWLLRRIAPLHLAGWAIAFGWAVPGLLRTTSNRPPGWLSHWLSSAALLSAFVRPGSAGYPLAWVLSTGFWTGVLLIMLATVANVLHQGFARLGPFGRAARYGRPARIGPVGPFGSILLVALAAVPVGVALLLTGPAGGYHGTGYQSGLPALGRGLLGLGLGMLTFIAVRAGTGTIAPPTAAASPGRRFPAGIGAGLALVALLLCGYRSDLVDQAHLLPVFPVAAVLIYCLARDDESLPQRLLGSAGAQWLGARAFAFVVLSGAVLLTTERLNTDLHVVLHSKLAIGGLLVEVLAGSLICAELGHRGLERLLAGQPVAVLALTPFTPNYAPAVGSIRRDAIQRTDGVAAADAGSIQPELRLRSLPGKPAPAAPTLFTPLAPPTSGSASEASAGRPNQPAQVTAPAAAVAVAAAAPAKKTPVAKRANPAKKVAGPTKATPSKVTTAPGKGAAAKKPALARKKTVDVRATTVDLTPTTPVLDPETQD